MKRFRLLYKYFVHFFTALNTGGFGVHSPFVFHFTDFVLRDKSPFYSFQKIELMRIAMKTDSRVIDVLDYGTGSNGKRLVSDIAHQSLKSRKYGELLFRTVNTYKMRNILELGTSLGVTTSYLASSSAEIKCLTLEGCPQTAGIANDNFRRLGLKNIEIVVGNIDTTLPQVIGKIEKLDLIFFDANHRMDSVIQYFELCLTKIDNNSIMIFDDIYWSFGMEKAWQIIKEHPKVTTTIDLFQIGIVFFNPDLHKKHYKMRY